METRDFGRTDYISVAYLDAHKAALGFWCVAGIAASLRSVMVDPRSQNPTFGGAGGGRGNVNAEQELLWAILEH